MHKISDIPESPQGTPPSGLEGTRIWIQGKIEDCLRPHPEFFLSMILDMDEKKRMKYLKNEKPEEIRVNMHKTYYMLLTNLTLRYGVTYSPYEESVKHFLGNLTQRITYYLIEGDKGRTKILRILRLFSALDDGRKAAEMCPLFKMSKARFSRKAYQVEPWLEACEKYFGI